MNMLIIVKDHKPPATALILHVGSLKCISCVCAERALLSLSREDHKLPYVYNSSGVCHGTQRLHILQRHSRSPRRMMIDDRRAPWQMPELLCTWITYCCSTMLEIRANVHLYKAKDVRMHDVNKERKKGGQYGMDVDEARPEPDDGAGAEAEAGREDEEEEADFPEVQLEELLKDFD
ncbi:hypothetical protein EV363DRAFT_858877 [Boletus edulis]|nr:hypothetical protein EV363DRAFT_858877 [Boletus edulis]